MTDNTPLAVAYYINGINFRISAETLAEGLELDSDGRPSKLLAVPVLFLASHAAELFLKAALLKRGFDEAKLRKFDYRHNLVALLKGIQGKGLPVTTNTERFVEGMSEQHNRHQLRYTVLVSNGTSTYWPPLSLVFAALDELLLLTRISTHANKASRLE